MTEADKTEIANLLATQRSLIEVGKAADAPYYNKGVSDYAKAAIEDAKEVKKFAMDTIQNNLELFFNLKDLRIKAYSTISNFIREGACVLSLGDFINVRLCFAKLVRSPAYHSDRSYDCDYFMVNAEEVKVEDFFVHTSDTALMIPDWEYKDERVYNIVCWEDLFWKHPKNYDLKLQKPGGWDSIKSMAERTRKVSALAVYALRKVIQNNVGAIRAAANKCEKTKEQLARVEEYKKVSA